MTLQQAKYQVALNHGYSSWSSLLKCCLRSKATELSTELTKLYASEKVKEALQLSAERATTKMSKGRNGCKVVVDRESILSLETELIEQINKEI